VFIFGANVKQIPAGNAVRAIVENVQTVAAPHQHQLAKLVRVFGKDVLRIAIRHRNSLLAEAKSSLRRINCAATSPPQRRKPDIITRFTAAKR
jgi:hypothetical protein